MANFILQDAVEQASGFMIAALNQSFLDRRRGIKAACFEQARHQSHPCKHIVGGALGHVPQTGVGRAVAVIVAERLQTLAQNDGSGRSLRRRRRPRRCKRLGYATKAGGMVEGRIDRRKLDMNDGMATSGRGLPGL